MVNSRSRIASILWWRSPKGDAAYARPALLAIITVAGVLFSWRLDEALYHPYFSAAVRSMTFTWKAFAFGSFDPANTVTIDKIPGFLWPQAISARIFGFHGWSLVLPQVVAGIACVLVLYQLVARWMGVDAALLAAAIFTLTPVTAGLFRSAVEDPIFTLMLLLAARAVQTAIATGRRRSLLAAAAWVGVAFHMKMFEAWAVLPAFAVVYVLAAPGRWRRRVANVALAGVLTAVVSAAWVLAVSATPAHERPYVDGSTDNSAVSMVVGYNFLNRFTALGVPPTLADGLPAPGAAALSTPATGAPDGGWLKLLGPLFGSQVGWLYPLAGISAVIGIASRRREPRTDPQRAGFVVWTGWLGVFLVAFTVGTMAEHVTYLGVIAAPVAALCGAGLVVMTRAFRTGRWSAIVLPFAVIATAAWSFALDAHFPTFRPWVAPLTAVLCALALTAMLVAKTRAHSWKGASSFGVAIAVAAMVVTPATWAATVLDPAYPVSLAGRVGPSVTPETTPAQPCCTATLTNEEDALLSYVASEPSRFTLVTSAWDVGARYIRSRGTSVLALGGFSTAVPVPTLEQFRRYAARGEVRFVLLQSYGDIRHADFAAADSTARPHRTQIAEWVRDHCRLVAPTEYAPQRTRLDVWTNGTYLFDCSRSLVP